MDPNQNILGLFTQISVLYILTGQREQTRQTTMHLKANYSSHKESMQEVGAGAPL
jgi:superfamily I DNA/RNA helicase